MHTACQIAIGASAVLGTAWIAAEIADHRRRVRQRRLESVVAAARGDQPEDEAPVSVRRAAPSERRRRLLSNAALVRLDAALAAAGNNVRTPHLIATGVVGWALITAFLALILGLNPLIAAALGTAAGAAAAFQLLRGAQTRYRRQFLELFPDALDLVTRAIQSGLPVVDAIGMAAREIPAPVGSELQRAVDEMRIGVEMEDAFQHTADRIRVADFQFFVVTLALQRRTGGALAETLSNLSSMIRRRKEVRLRTRALSAEARGSAAVLGALPIVIGGALFVINHDLMKTLIIDPRARFVLGLAITFMATGILVMVGLIKRSAR